MTDYSVLMSVYHKEKAINLSEAINSMLRQTVMTNDFVIVCDGPLNKSLDDVIEDFDKSHPGLFNIVRLEKNGGLANALNKGMKYCKNEIIARMDSDDISEANRMAKQLEALEEQHADIVGSYVVEFNGTLSNKGGKRIVPVEDEDIKAFAKKRNPFNHPSVVFKKSKVEAAGGYPRYDYFEDYALWVTMLSQGDKGYNVGEVLVNMRAGDELYNRRGGLGYVKCIVRFNKYMKELGYITTKQFLTQSAARSIVSIMPNFVRKFLYKKKLRG